MPVSPVGDSVPSMEMMEKAAEKKVEPIEPTGKGAQLKSDLGSENVSALDSIQYGPPELGTGGVLNVKE